MEEGNQEYEGTEPPRGVSSRRKGWQGEELEMEHQQEASRSEKHKVSAAVDIKQFQNHVVGKGYQAKHVIRQPSASASVTNTRDMTGGKAGDSSKEVKSVNASADPADYIKNAGLREFRREIENILSS
jgi:hypothetical protein